MNIRLAQKSDLIHSQKIIKTAFSDKENKIIIKLAADLFKETDIHLIKSFVAEINNQVIGFISFSPIFLKSDTEISVYILSPIAVSPEHQKQGIGSNLIKSGIDILTNDGAGVLLVYGDPNYYGRFGFNEEIGRMFIPPYSLDYPFGWTGMMLSGTAIPEQTIQFDCVSSLSNPDLW